MMPRLEWTVSTTDYTLANGVPEAVTVYHWRCTATEEADGVTVTESVYGTVDVPEGDPAAAVPTDEADAVAKMLTLVDQAEIEGILTAKFEQAAQPESGQGKLWEFPTDATAWAPGVSYAVGDKVIFDGLSYNVIQAHTSQAAWRPPVVPALFEVFRVPTGNDPIPWAPGEAVATGDLRTFEGTTYEVIQAHTTQTGWEPPNVPALWRVAP